MILHDVCLHEETGSWNILVEDGIILDISKNDNSWIAENSHEVLDLNGALALPGFINSHDHLDFNLFPRLGNKTYSNYRQWGPEIQASNKNLINAVLKIPPEIRVQWGIYKNLINGFTTVVNHGPYLHVDRELIQVYQTARSFHSVGFENNWKWKLNNPFIIGKPVVIHLGEGTDELAHTEIDEVIKSNLFNRSIIAVHGVAMSEKQAKHFDGLVWCPASNYFLLNKTADIPALKNKTQIVFGTDSTLTSPWNAWEHFRLALKTGMVDEKELLSMLTGIPAGLWEMNKLGCIKKNQKADIIALKKGKELFENNPEDILLVLVNGKIKIRDKSIVADEDQKQDGFTELKINNSKKMVKGNLPALISNIRVFLADLEIPSALR